MDGKPFLVRAIIINEEKIDEMKTLVFTHGIYGCCVMNSLLLKSLSEHYRIIAYDNCNWGLNTRTDTNDTQADKSEDEAHQWIIDFMLRTFEALDEYLPEKYIISGHSWGGYLSGLYAAMRPERIDSLIMFSPAIDSPTDEEYA